MSALAAIVAMVMVGRYSSSVNRSYGDLKPVIVLTEAVRAGHRISPALIARRLTLRRVPARFVPAGAIALPERAIGLETVVPMPAGSYLTANSLRSPKEKKPDVAVPGRGRHAVEIAVSGAGALGRAPGPVDVLVTTEPGPGGRGRTSVAASAVPLLSVVPTGAGESDPGPGLTRVTLGLTRPQAIRLIGAESYARRITLLPGEGGGR